jgi:hypothetical protein
MSLWVKSNPMIVNAVSLALHNYCPTKIARFGSADIIRLRFQALPAGSK